MSSRFRNVAAAVGALAVAALVVAAGPMRRSETKELRVCADPNNLPFSNAKGEGFENRIAQLVAREMDAKVKYTWWAQRRGFIRNTIAAGECDLVVGIPSSFERTAATTPYYRSSYVFVTRS
jgi:mxaJ protein